MANPSGVTVAALTHDFTRKRSIVTMVWDTDPEKKIGLPVPFGCELSEVREEAEKALRDLSAEIGGIPVHMNGMNLGPKGSGARRSGKGPLDTDD